MSAAPDILSTLPDPLLGIILSKIPVREAVRCSVLSKRWRFLYAQSPRLTLSPFLLLGSVYPDPYSFATVEEIISNLLLLHSSNLEAFHLFNYISEFGPNEINDCYFTPQSVWQWVSYAASKNVQSLSICVSSLIFPVEEIVPPAFFHCTRLTALTLHNYILTCIPTPFSGFNHLITCSFVGMEFTDDSLSCFLSHTPFLEDLSVLQCVGLTKPIISAPNLQHLCIGGEEVEVFTINCPKLRTLKCAIFMEQFSDQLIMIHDLRVNGLLFHELSYSVCGIANLDDGNMELQLNLRGKPFSAHRFLEIVGRLKTLKTLFIAKWPLFESDNQLVDLLHKLLERLPVLEQLKLGAMFDLKLERDPMLPCTTSLLDNLRNVKLRMIEFDMGEIAVIGKLLESASALEIIEVEVPPCLTSYERATRVVTFLKSLLYLSRASTRARISVKDRYSYL